MTPAQVDRLFQEFSQADGSTTRRHGGTGLGLTITKRLVTLMGGEITVASEPHKGTQFICTITLPRAMQKQTPEMQTTTVSRSLKALIVDDHEPARLVLHTMLSLFDIESVMTDSGEAALQLLALPDSAYDLIFIDWIMPGMDGEELIAAIRTLPDSLQPVIAVVSAYDLERIHELCEEQGICHFLPKPVLPKDLRLMIEEARQEPGATDTIHIQPTSDSSHRLQGMRILLVEDNVVNQQIAAEMLDYHNILVDIANNGQEALDMINAKAENWYHAVLMDIQMPVMDGYEATRLLRAQHRHATLPIIAMTAHAMVEEKERCKGVGMNAHVAKPFELENLLQTLAPYYTGMEFPAQQPSARASVPALPRPLVACPESIPGIAMEKGLGLCSGKVELYRKI